MTSTQPVNILCMKWGSLYGADYVRILRNAVAASLSRPHRFVCFTDNPADLDGIETLPIPEPFHQASELYLYRHGWPKLTVFKKQIHDLQGQALFLDLDIVVMGGLDGFFTQGPGLHIMRQPRSRWSRRKQKEPANSSVFAFTIGEQTQIFEAFMENPQKAYSDFRNEQAFLAAHAENLHYWPEEWCLGFKHGLRRRLPLAPREIPPQARIISFYGSVKPHHMAQPELWRKRLSCGLRTLPWAQDYWNRHGGSTPQEHI